MIILHDEAYYESRKPQPDLGPFKNFLRFIWNNEKKTFLDRTVKEWGLVGVFYTCFFSVLGAIFALQMWISIDYVARLDKPLFLYSGLQTRRTMGTFPMFRSPLNFDSPGVGFKPNILLPTTSPIIWVNQSNANARPKRYIQALTDFLQGYKKNESNYDSKCNNGMLRSNIDKPCFFDVKNLGACGRPPYGYSKPLQPCVLIKFNKRFDWTPDYYNRSSALPQAMPSTLKGAIKNSTKFRIWLSCDGVQNVDKEHVGEIEYIPSPGFPVQFFPFTGHQDYLSPIVALRFKNLTPNRLITVECALWAFNIRESSRYTLDFQIMIDK